MSRLLLATALLCLTSTAYAEQIQLRVDGISLDDSAILDMSRVRTRANGNSVVPISFQRVFTGPDALYDWYAATAQGDRDAAQVVITILDDDFVPQTIVTLDNVLPCGWILPAFDDGIETFSLCARATDTEVARPGLDALTEAVTVHRIAMTIDGLAADIELSSVSAIESTTRRNGGTTVEGVIIERAVADDDLAAWYAAVTAGTVETRGISLSAQDDAFVSVRQTVLSDAWPCDWSVAADGTTETITLCAGVAIELE